MKPLVSPALIATLGMALSGCDTGGASPSDQTFPMVFEDVQVERAMYGKIIGNDGKPYLVPCHTVVRGTLTIQADGSAELSLSGPGHSTSVPDGLGGRDCSTPDPVPIGWYLQGVANFSAGEVSFSGCNSSGFLADSDLRFFFPNGSAYGNVACVIKSGEPFSLGQPAMTAFISATQR
jgi:hypothetical protein